MRGQPVDYIENEIWKPIPHREVYHIQFYVSNLGRIKKVYIDRKGIEHEILVKPILTSEGRLRVTLHLTKNDYERVHGYVSTIVLTTFQGFSRLNIIHKDHDFTNCKLENLEYVTKREYFKHLKSNPYLRLSPAQYIDPKTGFIKTKLYNIPVSTLRSIFADYNSGLKQNEIARKHGVTQAYVSFVLNGKRRNQQTDILPERKIHENKRPRNIYLGVMVNQLNARHDKNRDS